MKRILHIVGAMNRAGAETMLMNLYRAIDRSSFQFDFVFFTSKKCDYDDEIIALGGRIFRTTEQTGSENNIVRIGKIRDIIEQQGQFYAVHSHMLFNAGFHAIAARMAGVTRIVTHSHNTSDGNGASIIGQLYRAASRICIEQLSTHFISCGEEAGKFLFPRIASDNVLFLPNAVDLRCFREQRSNVLHRTLELEDTCKIVLQVGRMETVKNFTFTIAFAKYLKDKGVNDIHFAFVGRGVDENKLKKQAVELDVDDKIHFLGVRSDVQSLMCNADLFFMPSLFEGFPVTLVEAQAAGLPCLISDSITTEVDLRLGIVDFKSLDADFEEWYANMLQLMNKKRVSEELISAVYKEKGFSVEESAIRLMNFYEQ